MRRRRQEPIGVVLAGGIGHRIGGAKAIVELRGQPLIAYPVRVLQQALRDVAIMAKADTALPDLPGADVWIESSRQYHPLVGITEALALAGGRPVLVCAADLPFITVELIGGLAAADPRGAPAVIVSCRGDIQPLLGLYLPAAAPPLSRALAGNPPVRRAVSSISPSLFEVDDPDLLFNVNAPEDLLRASAMLTASRT